ncbi:MAG: phosphatidylinositol alpha-1,6-mannosyltransferase [Gammaproteobacteria bacterium]|jgi:phosphatidylinositol alpha-1,6-mannosyltransferase
MRVLALVSDGFGAHGGIAAYNRELLNALGDSAQISWLRVLPRFAGCVPRHAKITQDIARRNRYRYALAVIARCVRESADWVFCGHVHHLPLACLAATLCGGRVWLQLHGIEAWQSPGRLTGAMTRRCDLVTAVSRVTRERFLSWSNVDPQRVKVLSNTFSPHFTPGNVDAALRERFVANGEALILTVSRLHKSERYKGHEHVMRALLEAPLQTQPKPAYVIAGDGDDVRYLQQRARDLGLEKRVHLIGPVAPSGLRALYRSADVFVMPSTGEGFGIVYLEAAACGIPVVGGDADGARDALREGELGALVDARDPVAIAQAIRTAIDTPHAPQGTALFSRAQFREQLRGVLASA